MADAQARIEGTAGDNATETLQKVQEAVQKVEQGQKQATEASSSWKSQLDGLSMGLTGMTIGTAATAFSLGLFVKSALEAADELQMIHSRAQVVYGTDFPEMTRKANELADSMGRDASDILNFATHLTSFSESMG